MLDVQVCFLPVPAVQLKDPGDQLKRVQAFRKTVEDSRAHLVKDLRSDDEFEALVRSALGAWRRIHEQAQQTTGGQRDELTSSRPEPPTLPQASPLDSQAQKLLQAAFRMAGQAQWEAAVSVADVALQGELLDMTASHALLLKAFGLGTLGRSDEAIGVYDELLARFGNATEPALREQVAQALFNKGFSLGALGRNEEAVECHEAVIACFGQGQESTLEAAASRAWDELTRIAYESQKAD